jgi:hypothetical protein
MEILQQAAIRVKDLTCIPKFRPGHKAQERKAIENGWDTEAAWERTETQGLERLAGRKPVAQSDYTGCIQRKSGAGPFCA